MLDSLFIFTIFVVQHYNILSAFILISKIFVDNVQIIAIGVI